MKDTSSFGDVESRNSRAERYIRAALDRKELTWAVRLAHIEGFVYGMVVMAMIVMVVFAYFMEVE